MAHSVFVCLKQSRKLEFISVIGEIVGDRYLYYYFLYDGSEFANLKGYQTIQIPDALQNKLKQAYEVKKVELFSKENIKSYTAYAQKLLGKAIDLDILEGRFEIINRYDDRVELRDYFKVKDVEVSLKGGRVFCEKDNTGECIHTGFVLGDAEIIRRANELGLKLRKAQKSEET